MMEDFDEPQSPMSPSPMSPSTVPPDPAPLLRILGSMLDEADLRAIAAAHGVQIAAMLV